MKTTPLQTPPPLSGSDRYLLLKLQEVIDGSEQPVLLGREGAPVQVPEPLFHILTEAVRLMASGQSVVLLSENEEFTTQAAAKCLGMSRPHLVKLLEGGEIPFHFVGTHRRVYLNDLQVYERKRDENRRRFLDRLAEEVASAGLARSNYTGDA